MLLRFLLVVLVRRQNHEHIPSFHIGVLLHNADILQCLFDSAETVAPDVLVGDFTPAESDAELHLLAFLQPSGGTFDVELKVILVRFGTELNFLDGDLDLILLGFAFLAPLFILELPIIHDAADGRLGIRRHLDQIQPGIISPFLCIMDIHHADIGIGAVNQSDFAYAAYISINSMW